MKLPEEIGLDLTVAQMAGLVAVDMDGEKVMLNIENGKYFGLDSIGSRIWELIEKVHTVQEVVDALLTEYDVEEETCQNEVLMFLNTLHAQGLVAID
jgi:hypothetical protein